MSQMATISANCGIGLLEQHAALAARADEADAHGAAAHRALDGGGGRERGHGGRAREHAHEVAASELLLLRGEVHRVASATGAACARAPRSRSSPAMRSVRNASTTATAAASIRFLLTSR